MGRGHARPEHLTKKAAQLYSDSGGRTVMEIEV